MTAATSDAIQPPPVAIPLDVTAHDLAAAARLLRGLAEAVLGHADAPSPKVLAEAASIFSRAAAEPGRLLHDGTVLALRERIVELEAEVERLRDALDVERLFAGEPLS